MRLAEVSRDFDGKYVVSFPEAPPRQTAAKTELQQILARTESELTEVEPFKTEASLTEAISDAFQRAHTEVSDKVIEEMPSFVYYSHYGNLPGGP